MGPRGYIGSTGLASRAQPEFANRLRYPNQAAATLLGTVVLGAAFIARWVRTRVALR